MAALLLTPDNIDFAKRALRSRFPSVKSSHRIEAFAAATGHRTHAALLADLMRSEGTRALVTRVNPDRFVARLHELGYGTADLRTLTDIVRSTDIPQPIWREYRNRDLAENDRWFRECERRDIPNVYIKMRRKYAELNWDCISIDPSGEKHVRDEQGTTLVGEMFRRFQSLARPDPGKSEFFGSAFVGSIDRLLPEIARNMADEMFMLLYTPMPRQAAA